MHDQPSRLWDELVEEFRALGGTMDNVRLGHGPLGRGLFVIDPARPFLVRAPENLLVSVSDIVFENGAPKVAAGAGMALLALAELLRTPPAEAAVQTQSGSAKEANAGFKAKANRWWWERGGDVKVSP